MTISERIFEATAGVRDRASTYAQRMAEAARSGAERAADRIKAAETPVEMLTDAARQLNALSHRYVGRVLDQGASNVHGFLADGSQRLRRAAQAETMRDLYREQLESLPASRDRIVENARATWSIVADAGRELQTLALTTYAHLVRGETRKKAATTKPPKAAKRKSRARRAA